MNILILASRVIYGGGEKVINWLTHNLIREGHNVIYASPRINSDYIEKLKLVGLYNKVQIVEYPHHIKYRKLATYSKSFNRILHDCKVDLFVIFGGSLVEQLIARTSGVKILLSERCNPKSRPFFSRLLKHIQYHIADAYVFQTKEACYFYGKDLESKSKILPNPIIDELQEPIFSNLRKEIVSVGRLCKEKNQIMLLKAFYEAKLFNLDYKLIFYGSGPSETEIRDLIKQYTLSDYVSIIKGQTNIADLINGASLFVLTSNNEGMPNALIEAMSMGVLSISTDCPIYGPRMLIENGVNGFLVPINNVEELSKTMLYALSYSKSDDIRKEACKIREMLQSTKIFNQWKLLIENI